jgi:aldehyde:ferredoxin oxidoreductase
MVELVGGYTGQILEIDLTDESVRKTPLDLEIAKKFIGGRGLADKLFWDRMKPGIDPLSPENQFMLFTGPLTGFLTGNVTVARFKSPLVCTTNGIPLLGHAATGGHWGPELKAAGYDGVIITGKAEKPVYIYIKNDDIEIRDAKHLWGKITHETEPKIKNETDPLARVLCIGPAGENLVRYASIQQEYFRGLCRCGSGAVWGSKNLKAIAIRGTKDLPLENPEAYKELFEKVFKLVVKDRQFVYLRRRWGSITASLMQCEYSTGPIKNWREAYWDEGGKWFEPAAVFQWESRCRVKNRGCYGCITPCMQLGVIRKGPHAGMVDNPDFDSTALIGPNCMVTDPNGLYALEAFIEQCGLDSISFGNVVSWAMECYEKGIITKQDLDGIELTWGNVDAMFKLAKKVTCREGIGDLLAEGVKRASEKVGKGSEKFAMHCKGVEWGAGGGAGQRRDVHMCYNYAMSSHGGVHKYGSTIAWQNGIAMFDSLTYCYYHSEILGGPITWEIISEALKVVTGLNLIPSEDDWNKIAWRILMLERVWNLREGYRPERDDILPDRVHDEPLTQGPKAGTPAAIYPREQFEVDKQRWYKERGCDTHGIPTKETLKTLDLDFVIPWLEKLNLF